MPIVTKSDKIDLNSEKKTEQLAYKLSKKIKPGNVVFFFLKNCRKDASPFNFIKFFIKNYKFKPLTWTVLF